MPAIISNVNLQVLSLLKALTEASKASKIVSQEIALEKENSTSPSNESIEKKEPVTTNINLYG